MNKGKLIAIAIVVLLFIIILIQNTDEVTLNLFFWELDIALYYIPVIMILCVGLGFLISRFWNKIKKKDDLDFLK